MRVGEYNDGLGLFDDYQCIVWVFLLAPWKYWGMGTWLHLKLTLPHYKYHMGWHKLYLTFITIWWK